MEFNSPLSFRFGYFLIPLFTAAFIEVPAVGWMCEFECALSMTVQISCSQELVSKISGEVFTCLCMSSLGIIVKFVLNTPQELEIWSYFK